MPEFERQNELFALKTRRSHYRSLLTFGTLGQRIDARQRIAELDQQIERYELETA